jgi:hypothetical protein
MKSKYKFQNICVYRRMRTQFQWVNGKGRNNLPDLDIDGSEYLKWVLKEVLHDEVYGIDTDQDRDQWRFVWT